MQTIISETNMLSTMLPNASTQFFNDTVTTTFAVETSDEVAEIAERVLN